jgi:glycosyltransferase involved in cell wall biosynthesis
MDLKVLDVTEKEEKKTKFEEDPLISFIVPVHANNLDQPIFKRCLMSLEDQDYGNLEVVIVLNGGEDEVLEKTAQFYVDQNPEKFKLVKVKEGGACNARNVGFENSKGDIVSFFNSDYRANPGMARMWVDALVEHPDCAFAYGGYEYATAPAYAYGSKSFDPFLLTQANYIDCGFPIWRKHVAKWDPEVKSLQDWDFWLSVSKGKNLKGYFIERDISFVAEKPRPKGLSDDSSNNWVERVNFIKKKHGIELSNLVVTSLGAPNHGVEIAKMLKADYRDDTIFKPNQYKAVYMIGFYMRPDQPGNAHGSILGSFAPEVKKIVHFVGADIYWLRKFPWDALKTLAGIIKMGSDHILSENEQAQKELREFGIESKVVPIPPYNDYEVKPLPDKFTVAMYLTDKSDFDKYLQKHTLSIVRAMPDVQFTGYGDGGKDFFAPNFKHHGNMSKEKYKEYVYGNSCLLRLVRHDTRPQASNDFMLAGRTVISNIPFECTDLINTKGTEPMNDWDIFSAGFSDYRWPNTKAEIVQTIRKVKNNPYSVEFKEDLHYKINSECNKEKYISTIKKLSEIQI